jgi:hypothetical protein
VVANERLSDWRGLVNIFFSFLSYMVIAWIFNYTYLTLMLCHNTMTFLLGSVHKLLTTNGWVHTMHILAIV